MVPNDVYVKETSHVCVCVFVSRRAWRKETSYSLGFITSSSQSSFSTWPWCQMASSRSTSSGFISPSLLLLVYLLKGSTLHESDFHRTTWGTHEIERSGDHVVQDCRKLSSGHKHVTGRWWNIPGIFFKCHHVWNCEHPNAQRRRLNFHTSSW